MNKQPHAPRGQAAGPTAGKLTAPQWAALARLYAAGSGGVESIELRHTQHGFHRRTLNRLEHFTPAPLIRLDLRGPLLHQPYYQITAYGIRYYEREWPRYRQLYRQVYAPRPKRARGRMP